MEDSGAGGDNLDEDDEDEEEEEEVEEEEEEEGEKESKIPERTVEEKVGVTNFYRINRVSWS